MARKVLIKEAPQPKGKEPIKVNKTLQPTEREEANMEVEKGEVIVSDSTFSGFPDLFVAGGENHSEGGTPVNLPANSFVFSKDKSLRITDEDVLKDFNKSPKKIGYDPAEIAKQYQLNNYRKILADPDSDKMQRSTAELMIKNYNAKLGQLALIQESRKGFENGIPFISIPYLEDMGIDPAKFVMGGNGEEPEVPTSQEEDDNVTQKKMGGQFDIRILKKPRLKKGGEGDSKKKSDTEFAYNPEFYADLAQKLGTDITALLPATLGENKGQVPDKQKAIGKGSYGRKDWMSAELFPDFRNRNAWYFEKNPNFNPKDKEQVKDFQRAYNERAQSMGLRPYFKEQDPKNKSKYDVDGQFGEVTYLTPNLDTKPQNKPIPFEEATSNTAVQQPLRKPNISYTNKSENADFWTQDLVNMSGAFGDYSRLKKYMPWQAGYQTTLPGATYYDPTRELAANAEQANIADTAMGMFAGPQSLSARVSDVQGKALDNAANILGKYNNLNVGIANTLEANRTNILNSDSQTRGALATGLYDKTVMANQSFDNAKAMARKNLRDSFVNAWTNRGQTQALNAMNKQYKLDPLTGFVTPTGEGADLPLSDQDQAGQLSAAYDRIKEGRTETEAIKIFDTLYGNKSKSSGNDDAMKYFESIYGKNK